MDFMVKEWVMMSLAKKWKDFKGRVKEQWFKNQTIDPRVFDEQFEWLRRYWDTNTARVLNQ